MGTAPANYPPETVIPVGGSLVGTLLGLTSGFPATTFFTAPTAGIYHLALYIRFIATDGTGTLTATMFPPHAPAYFTIAGTPAIDRDLPLSPRPYWFNAGDMVTVSCVGAGLGATTYNAYLTALRLF